MIGKELLDSRLYAVNDYWFNVYSDGPGFKYSTRENCEEAAFYLRLKPLYRIHVRLK